MKKKIKYIGIDFDGTIVENKFPQIGELLPNAKETIKKFKEAGYTLVLWTCRTDENLREAEKFLEDNEIEFDYINENPEELKTLYGNDPRKIGVDVFIDDRNMQLGAGDTPIDWLLIKFNADINWELPEDE